MSQATLVLVIGLAVGLLTPLLGGLLGAALSRAALWKGPAIVGIGMVGQLAVGLVMALTGFDGPILLDWLVFLVFAGLAAWALGVAVGPSAAIIICGVLALVLSSIAVVLGVPYIVGGLPSEVSAQ